MVVCFARPVDVLLLESGVVQRNNSSLLAPCGGLAEITVDLRGYLDVSNHHFVRRLIGPLVMPLLEYQHHQRRESNLSGEVHAWDTKLAHTRRLLAQQGDSEPRTATPDAILYASGEQGRATLSAIIGCPADTDHASLVAELRKRARGTGQRLRRDDGPTYPEILGLLCKKLGLPGTGSVDQLERNIAIKLFNTMWERLSETEQAEILKNIAEATDVTNDSIGRNMVLPVIGAAGMAAAQASGFGVFIAASTVVGAATHAVGFALPFVFYTSMSKAIALVIGPPGWLALGGYAVRMLLRDNRNYVLLGNSVALLAALRAKQQIQWESDVAQLQFKQETQQSALRAAVTARVEAAADFERARARLVRLLIGVAGVLAGVLAAAALAVRQFT